MRIESIKEVKKPKGGARKKGVSKYSQPEQTRESRIRSLCDDIVRETQAIDHGDWGANIRIREASERIAGLCD